MTKRYHTPNSARALRHATLLSSYYSPLADDGDYCECRPIPWINL